MPTSANELTSAEQDLLNNTDEKFLRALFENIQLYRHRRPESSKVMLPVVAGWAMAAAVNSAEEAYELAEEAKKKADKGEIKEVFSTLSSLFPDPTVESNGSTEEVENSEGNQSRPNRG